MTAGDPQRRSILARLNLESPSASEEISANRLRGDDVTRRTEPEREERSTAESDPKAFHGDPKNGEAENEPQWVQVRRRFVESNANVSLRALADEFLIPYPTLKRRAQKEGWRSKREAFRQKLDEQIEKAALVSRAEAYQIQERAARETIGIFARVFDEKARALRADPGSKSAAEDLAKLIQLQLDVTELGLTVLGDTEIDWRAERLSARQAAPQIH